MPEYWMEREFRLSVVVLNQRLRAKNFRSLAEMLLNGISEVKVACPSEIRRVGDVVWRTLSI